MTTKHGKDGFTHRREQLARIERRESQEMPCRHPGCVCLATDGEDLCAIHRVKSTDGVVEYVARDGFTVRIAFDESGHPCGLIWERRTEEA